MELENGNIWQGPATLNIETMVWNLPIKIYPTTPLQISQGLQSQLKHKLAVWEVRKCKLMCPQQTECVQLMWNSWCMILHLVSICLYQICLSRLWNELTWSAYYNESLLPVIYVGLSFVCLRSVNWHLDNNLQLNQHPVQRTAHSPTTHPVKLSFPHRNTVQCPIIHIA